MNLLNVECEFPRQFCPSDFSPSQWDEVVRLYDQLVERDIGSSEDLEKWILDFNELDSILQEEEARRFILNACHTNNQEYEDSYIDFLENIKPKLEPLNHKVKELYLQHREKLDLPRRYEMFHRSLANQVQLFSEDNIPLQTKEARLCQEYQKVTGGLTVEFKGEEKTLAQMTPYLQEQDRPLREQAWRAINHRRYETRHKLDDLFDELFALRVEMAKNAGHSGFESYCFAKMERFDYTPQDCERFHQAIEEVVVPKARELGRRRREKLGVDTLRPWDLWVDPSGQPPLKPFADTSNLLEQSREIFHTMDPELAEQLYQMEQRGLLDLDNRKNKAPGGFQHALEEVRYPFIFMNAVGLQRDVETLFHEAGHAFNYFAVRNEPLVSYRHPPIEFAEVASMSMELLTANHWEKFYPSREDFLRAKKALLEGIIEFFPWASTIDAFQRKIYQSSDHSAEDRVAMWLEVMDRFGGIEDWSGVEDYRAYRWQKQLHIFEVPFYYIEYALAQLGAIQVWLSAREDSQKALDQYKAALQLGGSRPLTELYQTAGAEFIFSSEKIAPIIDALMAEIDRMEGL